MRLFVPWALTLWVALGACWPARLAAQTAVPSSFPPPPHVLNLSAPLPANGCVLFDKIAGPVWLTAPGEPPIDGSWLGTPGLWGAAWKPSRMPQPDLPYTLFVEALASSYQVSFGPAWTPALPSFTSQLQVERGEDQITQCCSITSHVLAIFADGVSDPCPRADHWAATWHVPRSPMRRVRCSQKMENAFWMSVRVREVRATSAL